MRASRRGAVVIALGAVGALTIAACGGDEDEIRVAAASSLVDVVAAIDDRSDTDPAIATTLAGSATLARQLLDGLTVDVFVSADRTTMAGVVDAGLVEGEPIVVATNALVIVAPADNRASVASLDDLAAPGLLVGLCAPEVPCGRLARTDLAAAGLDVTPDTEEPNVRSLLAKVREGELDAALVYRSDALAAGDDVVTVADPRLAGVNEVVAAVVVGGDVDRGRSFVTALLGGDGQRIFAEHGFGQAP